MTTPVVLVVEDDPIVREYAALVFAEDLGCRTLHAANAEQAIQILDNHPEITTAFIDVLMSGNMDGVALATVLNISYPRVHVVLTSGAMPDGIEHFDFILKPWDVDQLRRLIKLPPSTAAGAPAAKVRALVVLAEDDAIFNLGTRSLLESAGYHVRATPNGREALSAISRCMADFLVTDLAMPIMDGAELIRTIAKKMPDLRIVILSSSERAAKLVIEEYPHRAIRFVPKHTVYSNLIPTLESMILHSRRQSARPA